MQLFLITLAVFLIAAAGMSVGVVVAGKRIKGSCGGLAGFKDDRGNPICEACTNPSPQCSGAPRRDPGPAPHAEPNRAAAGSHPSRRMVDSL